MNTENIPVYSASGSASGTLKLLASRYRKKLFFTFLLVVAENVTYLLYPILAGTSINAILSGQTLNAVLYGLMILFIWCLGAARRSVDTRTFARIYAALAVSVVMTQRKNNLNHSTIAARVALSREFVDFFELHLPMLITSLVSMVGAAVMLLIIESCAGIACLVILAFLACFLPGFARKNEALYNKLNNRLEKEVDFVTKATTLSLTRHYSTLAKLRIRLSDREAIGYLSIGVLVAMLFSLTIIWMTQSTEISAGHIYSVMTYMWMFATSLDDGPQLLEKYSQLKDIGKRVSTETGE
ncbi:ABC transporter six-transmembrane domain-containing protein [Yersinia enterocolitica]|nr:ABC transporter six-transmembrane domain-containing protein [Yersinia enterocolitica]ELI8334893.1 ABC transporter six-transmembrane domain-containing protein [Yersinia enterocolitica]ELW8946936.1 ABC transporter six-transmembrane domain-containing protein [Yersinia enterocolitica]HDL6640471.1 ABC transporter six-transmembrane domain-containing protein [Yersinia enterocolitica]HDL6662186.1 ABC transporter six-transmembrane domain-containing protein [Yersinia enterocolitica]